MTPLDVVLSGDLDSVDDYVETARLAEDLGYEQASLPEVTGRDAVTLLATLAAHTDEIGLTNDVFSPYSRSPALLGQTAVTLAEASDGRYRLGLGASSPDLTEGWHGAEFDRPLRRLRETVEIVRQVASGGPVDYDGEAFDLGGLRLSVDPPAEPPPVDVAALGPKAVELAGRFADGWVPQLFTPAGLRDRLDDLRRGADLGGRSADDLRVALTLRCFADEDAGRARTVARGQLAFMVGAYGPYYRESLARQGYREVVDEVHDAWTAGDRERATASVPDGLLDDLVAVGEPEAVRERVERFGGIDGVDAIRVGFFGRQTPAEREATMRALAPDGD